MKKIYIIFAALLLMSTAYSQQTYQDVIYLKNGDVATGMIVENVPNSYVKLETPNESVVTFKYTDIKKFTKEKIVKNKNLNATSDISTTTQDPALGVNSYEFNSLALGLGNSYGGVGVNFEHRFGTLAVTLGVGYFPAPANYAHGAALYSAGIKLFVPNSSLYLNLQFGSFGIVATELNIPSYDYTSFYSYSTQKVLYGPSALFGNTFWFGHYIGLNGGLGVSYNLQSISWKNNETLFLALDLGLKLRL